MLKHCAISLVAVALSTTAFGQAKFSAEHGVLNWSSTSGETKVNGGTAVKSSETELNTLPAGLRLGAQFDKFSVYADPVLLGAAEVGFWAMDNLEAGVAIDLNSKNGKEGDKVKWNTTNNNFGVWGTYYMPMGSSSLEAHLGLMSKSMTSKKTDAAGVETKSNTTGMDVTIGADYVLPLAKNLSYIGGVSYSMMNWEEKESKTKNTGNKMALNLATTRWTW